MKILFTGVNPFIPTTGGVERVTDILCKQFIKEGYNCFYLTFNKEFSGSYQFPCQSFYLPDNDVTSYKSLEYYHKLLENLKIDIIFNQEGYYEYSRFFMNIGKLKIKRISVLHSDPNMHYGHVWEELTELKNNTLLEKVKRIIRPIFYFKFKRLYKQQLVARFQFLNENCEKVVVLSPSYVNSVVEHYPPLGRKLCSIANPNSFQSDHNHAENKEKICLFVGRLHNQSKNLFDLLKIWKIVSKTEPDWQLTIVGGGPDETVIKERAKALNIENIHFYPFQDPRPFFQRASVFCMTSRFEGFPMVLNEAIISKCIPILFDSFPAARDIIEDGKSGILIKPFDIKCIF